jgi:hypothetical protein
MYEISIKPILFPRITPGNLALTLLTFTGKDPVSIHGLDAHYSDKFFMVCLGHSTQMRLDYEVDNSGIF